MENGKAAIPQYKNENGDTNVCARCEAVGITTGALCYVRRKLIIVPMFQFEPEPRYIVDRETFEQELSAAEWKQGVICQACYVPNSAVWKRIKMDGGGTNHVD
jgi:hypothetical protein